MFLTVKEAAELLKVSLNTMRTLISSGFGPKIIRISGPRGHIRISRIELERWAEKRSK